MILSLLIMIGCAEDKSGDDAATAESEETSTNDSTEADETTTEEDTTTDEDTSTETEPSVCDQAYSFCGTLMMPDTFEGTTRSMSVALFSSLPPAGPPDYALAEVETPVFDIGSPYPIEIGAVTALGEYHLFVAVYMEGGGEWQPASGIDYMYSSAETFSFDGSAIDFGEVELKLAE